ncbi:3-hydroxyacyl-CoA dehydrogenase [Achromobacter aegrifaciens]
MIRTSSQVLSATRPFSLRIVKMATNRIHEIGVVGAGAMGRGIAQLFAQSGHVVKCFDAAEGAACKAMVYVNDIISRSVEKGRVTQAEAALIAGRLHACVHLEELANCDLVVEAVVEDLEVKRQLFVALEEIVSSRAILASNTSSLIVSEIAAGCRHPERVAGLHFFNPVPLMKVAEVVAAVRTAPAIVDALSEVVQAAGHRVVVTADQPGFLVNHAGRGFYTEALRLLEERVAGHADIDAVMRDAAGFRMGPFELMDLTGLDVSGKVMESIYEQFQQEPRFRPSSLVRPRIAAGLHGRKTGAGWYRYEGNSRIDAPVQTAPSLPAGLKVWIDPMAEHARELVALVNAIGAEAVHSRDADELIVVQPWGADATSYCIEHGLDAGRCVAIDPLPPLDIHRTVMLTVATRGEMRDAARALFAAGGVPVTVINDSPGYIVQRMLATIVNIAANIAQRGISSVADIEDAVKLGLGYPHGPLSWGDHIGGTRILTILRTMHEATGDPRYRPSPWLARRVGLGLSLLTAEAERGQR